MKFNSEEVAEELANNKQFWIELEEIASNWYNQHRRDENGKII